MEFHNEYEGIKKEIFYSGKSKDYKIIIKEYDLK